MPVLSTDSQVATSVWLYRFICTEAGYPNGIAQLWR